jgi:thiol-disulfide isomerase/thioredoxin
MMDTATKIINLITFFALCFIMGGIANAQKAERTPTQVGKPIGKFLLNDVRYYSKTSVTHDDFKGKWLILDFWNASCMVCLQAMPKMDSLQQKLTDNTQVMMVGYTGTQYHQVTRESDEKKIKELYERVKSNAKFNLPSAFDSTLFHRFDIAPCPYILIVDPEGIVRGITSRISFAQLDSIQRGLSVSLRKAYTGEENRQRSIQEILRKKESKR